ncbi:MAG: hypothetical protein Aureis2KO_25500 [Aureisphaera sp.]
MKKILILFVFVTAYSYAQVGIGTTDPQSDLHIAGDNSEVRIDGLNATNNANNNGTDLQPVFVDADGVLSLVTSPSSAEFKINVEDVIDEEVDTGPLGQANEEEIYTSSSFTLTRPAIVTVTYGTGITIEEYQGGPSTVVHDGKPKLYRLFFKLGNGTTASGNSYAKVGHTYTNNVDPLATGESVITGFIYVTASEHLYLPAGTYSVHLFARVIASTGSGGGTPIASDSFTAYFGGDSYVRVLVHY